MALEQRPEAPCFGIWSHAFCGIFKFKFFHYTHNEAAQLVVHLRAFYA